MNTTKNNVMIFNKKDLIMYGIMNLILVDIPLKQPNGRTNLFKPFWVFRAVDLLGQIRLEKKKHIMSYPTYNCENHLNDLPSSSAIGSSFDFLAGLSATSVSTLSASLLSRFEAEDLVERPLALAVVFALLRPLVVALPFDCWLALERVDLFETLLALDTTDSDSLSASSCDTEWVASSADVFSLRTISSDFSMTAD